MSTFSCQPLFREHILLPAAVPGTEALWIPAILDKSDAFVQFCRPKVVRNNLQLQLKISGLPGTFDAGLCQRPPDAESPPGFCDTDAEVSPVPCFFRRIDAVYACRADDFSVDLRQQRRVPAAFLLLFQVCFFLFQGKSDFFTSGTPFPRG